MNRIETNLLDLRAGIAQQAEAIARTTSPVARVQVSQGVGFTVADLLDLEAGESGRYAIVKVANASAVRTEIAELRQGATPVVRRMFSAFIKGLAEAETEAQRTHVYTIASRLEGLLMPTTRRLDGRPLAHFGVSGLVATHCSVVDFLENGAQLRADGDDELRLIADDLNIYTTVTSRFKEENGVVTHQFAHTIRSSGYNNAIKVLACLLETFLNSPDVAYRILVKRHNLNLNGGADHTKKFLAVVLETIEAELEARVAELAEQGLNLVVTKTPVAN